MEEQLVAQDKAAAIKDAKINEQDLEIQSLRRQIATLDKEDHKKDLEIRALNSQLTSKDDEIQELKKRLAKCEAESEELKKRLAKCEAESEELRRGAQDAAAKNVNYLDGKDVEIKDLKRRLAGEQTERGIRTSTHARAAQPLTEELAESQKHFCTLVF